MESEWSRNVLKYGLGDAGITLAARLLFDTEVITNFRWPYPDEVFYYNVPPAGSADPYTFGVIPKLVPGSNFPYGYVVEPPE